MENDNRRLIAFFISFAVILFGYQYLVLEPMAKRHRADAAVQQATLAAQHPAPGAAPTQFVPVAEAAAADPRVKLDSPSLAGTIDLRGARIDDLYLKHYRVSTDPKSPLWELFRPAGAEHAWFAMVGWLGANVPGLPDANTVWTAQPGAVLTPTTPLVLTYDGGQGLKFTRTIAVDADYLFTVIDTVANASAAPASLESFASVEQHGLPADLANNSLVHEGAIGMLSGKLELDKYKGWKKDGAIDKPSTGGWLGITQKYWLAALIPDQSLPIKAQFHVQAQNGVDVYQAGYIGPLKTIAPGASLTQTTRLFAGAKVVPILQAYEKTLGVPRFDQAVDWGHLFFLTQPLFAFLEFLKQHLGTIGVAILVMTVAVKLVLYPLADKSYESISKMRKIQPLTEELKKKYPGDAAKLQQETMALYQREKINPLMGCVPMLFQLPVLYSLTKIFTVTIEMRQAPFFGWVHDLASRDPTSIWTLFGLIHWNPATVPLIGSYLDGPLHLGAWPLIYGFTMWLSMSMSPPAPDPTQQRIMQLMPLFFTFSMSQFTVGLVIYWTWSNILSILQQYVIMRRFKVENPIDDFIGRFSKPKPPE
jgi:YidC/Oxa1 family membrane protein insertase